jgi:Holliday junction DNA helicase RuvB
LQPNDILFIDEIHRLPISVEEILYPAMEDGKIDILIGEGPGARSIQISLPPFTLIGATTRSGLLSQPLRERFGIPLTLQFYTPQEIEQILQKNAIKLAMHLDKSGAEEISKRCRGTPRIAGRLLRRVRDIAVVLDKNQIDAQLADQALNQLEIDQCGFDETDRKYLSAIENHYQGGPVGVETLAALLSEQRDMIEDVIEPYLIQQGYIQRTPRGRILTLQGKNYVITQHHAKYQK